MSDRLAAAGRLLVGMVIAADDRALGRDEQDILVLLADDLAELFDDEDVDQGHVWGTVALLRLVDVALSHAAYASGISRAELAVEVVTKATILYNHGNPT
jgi:hypothetical protein